MFDFLLNVALWVLRIFGGLGVLAGLGILIAMIVDDLRNPAPHPSLNQVLKEHFDEVC